MGKKLPKPLIKYYNVFFYVVKGLVNGCEFFWKWFFYQIFNINLNKIVWIFKKNLKILSKTFSRIFQEYFKNISHKAIKKQVSVAHVIMFAPICFTR
jgi:hypothetical protein